MADIRVVPSRPLQTALTKALACCNSQEPQIQYLEDLAKVAPELDDAVTQLRLKQMHLDALAREGLRAVTALDGTQERG